MFAPVRRPGRRSFVRGIGSLVVAGTFAGCSTGGDDAGELQAGSLVVENDHVVSHAVSVDVVEGPADGLGNPITSSGTVVVEPGESKSYPEWLTDGSSAGVTPGTYRVRLALDGDATEAFDFEPDPGGDEPAYVRVTVTDGGGLEWSVSVRS